MICIDTNVLIYAIQQQPPPTVDPELILRARRLMTHLSEQKEQLALPAPVVAEYLVKFDPKTRETQLAELSKRFMILPFDAVAVVFVANLLHKDVLKDVRKLNGSCRQLVRMDATIIAIAKRHHCHALVTHDQGMMRLAEEACLNVQPLPLLNEPLPTPPLKRSSGQASLFEGVE